MRRIPRSRFYPWLILMFAGATLGSGLCAEQAAIQGLPFIRSYSLADIGDVPRGSQLGFDRYGRVAAIHEAVYSVLNDNVWLNIAEPGGKGRIPLSNVIQAPDGRSYYGARGSWGVVEVGTDGRLHPSPLTRDNPPKWILTALFRDLIVTERGVYFASWNGVVYWDFKTRENEIFEVPGLSCAFKVGSRVYLSAYNAPLHYIDIDAREIKSASVTGLDSDVVELSTTLDSTRSLVSFAGGRIAVFDGQSVSAWLTGERNVIKGQISALERLTDGSIAVAVTGQGLLLFSPQGDLLLALTNSRYCNVNALANREPGVLWVATEDAIDKVLYGSPLSVFGEPLGLPVGWPITVRWNGHIYVSSAGQLYRSMTGRPGEPTRFELCAQQPPRGAFALAARGSRMLVGNGAGLYEAEIDGTYRSIPIATDLAQLVMIDEDHCYVIGHSGIELLEWANGQWTECASRIAGVRNPAVVHQIRSSVWIEMGGDGVARLWNHAGRLQLDVVPNSSWTKTSWVNIGAVGDTVVLSSLQEEQRRFFNEKTGAWCEAPQLQRLLDRSPYWIARMQQDKAGVIWATHNEGMVRFTPVGTDYEMDASTYDLVNDRYPIVRILPGNDVWIYAERSLYHVERSWLTTAQPSPKPILVSLVDAQRNTELLTASAPAAPLRLPYASNSLSFRFYSGGDAWRRVPSYEYRLNEDEPWTTADSSQISFRGLSEGSYRLQVRMRGIQPSADVSSLEFEIQPPWRRSWLAYVLLVSIVLLLFVGAMRWSSYFERRRNRMLEQVVHERTRQLEATMAKLGDETRNAATLAERDRLAGEIHDSVQQGLTGAILQLDTTLKLPAVGGDVRSRLNVVRNMVSYARQEVEHAVWDMESPLLDGADLADALQNLTTFVNSGGVSVDVSVSGNAVLLDRMANHNLLRIAQEATTNAFRHAKASRIAIRLEYGAENVTLEISDDGCGFSPDEVLQDRSGHLGLRGIRTRAKKLRASLAIESAQDKGTSIRVAVPMTGEQKESNNAAVRCIQ